MIFSQHRDFIQTFDANIEQPSGRKVPNLTFSETTFSHLWFRSKTGIKKSLGVVSSSFPDRKFLF